MAAQSEKPEVFELNNGSMHVKISNFGATILSLSVPDKQGIYLFIYFLCILPLLLLIFCWLMIFFFEGNFADVVLGFDSIEPHVVNFLSFLDPFFLIWLHFYDLMKILVLVHWLDCVWIVNPLNFFFFHNEIFHPRVCFSYV